MLKNINASILVDKSQNIVSNQKVDILLENENRIRDCNTSLLVDTRNKFSNMSMSLLVDINPAIIMIGGTTTIAWCYKLELTDGTVYGFTTHDCDLEIDGIVYEANTGFVPTATETSVKADVDTIDVDGCLKSDRITSFDIANGRYDGAKITVFICDWKYLYKGIFTVRVGTVGQVNYGKTSYQAEVRGLTDALQMNQINRYQKLCRCKFCDEKCKLDKKNYTYNGEIVAINNGLFIINLQKKTGHFDFGYIKFTSGKNIGRIYEIKHNNEAGIFLYEPPLFEIAIGDKFEITAGCNKNFSTCIEFGNSENFRGFPHIPGGDYQMSYPQSNH